MYPIIILVSRPAGILKMISLALSTNIAFRVGYYSRVWAWSMIHMTVNIWIKMATLWR